MSAIRQVVAREVLDSRGKPTVEAEVWTAAGAVGRAIVPSGASTGSAEARELRDSDNLRYDGQGVRRAVAVVQEVLQPAVLGVDASNQAEVDARLLAQDPSPQKVQCGGNALLAVSLAAAHAGAAARKVPLFRHFHGCLAVEARRMGVESALARPRMPLPMTNMISGGLHAGGNLDIQDVLVMPVGAADYATGLEWIVRVYRRLGELLRRGGYEGRLVGDEGGYGPRLENNEQAIAFVVQAIEAAGLRPGADMTIALDIASTHFYCDGRYRLKNEADRLLSADDMVARLDRWVAQYPITSIEDGLAEEDWNGWQELTRRLGSRVRLVGDDLFATSVARLRRGIASQVANSVLVKVNQIGTLTETFQTVLTARQAGYGFVVSARSGETEDSTIADLAVATAAEHIKIGSIVRSERLAKYNQLLRIQEQLGPGQT